VEVYLFEVFKKGLYTFVGRVEPAGEPYQEVQTDSTGQARSVWIFPVKPASGEPHAAIPLSTLKANEDAKRRAAKKLTDEDLEKRVKQLGSARSVRAVSTKYFVRNQYVAELAKRKAKGLCQLCQQSAPFLDTNGEPYLESHHVEWLSRGGPDTIENTVALCPNCHARVHVLDLDSDRERLQASKRGIAEDLVCQGNDGLCEE
jgi:5-methylcytosine-specific restriction enzyme A